MIKVLLTFKALNFYLNVIYSILDFLRPNFAILEYLYDFRKGYFVRFFRLNLFFFLN